MLTHALLCLASSLFPVILTTLQANSPLPATEKTSALAAPPVARKTPKTIELNGDRRDDPYFWLRDKSNPDVVAYLQNENEYTAAVMKPTEAFQEQLYKEIVSRIKETDLSVPAPRKGYLYYTRTEEAKQYPIWCRKKATLDAPEEIMVDANQLGEGKKYFQIGTVATSPDQNLVAYAEDTEGDEIYTVLFKDLHTGKLLADRIARATASVVWASDNKTVFYTVQDSALRPYKLFRHTLGTSASQDVEIYHEPDERFVVDISKSRSEAYLWLQLKSQTTSEIRYLRAAEPEGTFRVLYPRQQDIEYDVAHHGDSFFIRINDTGRNFRLIEVPVKSPAREGARELLPASKDVMLEDVDAFADHLVITERDQGLLKIRIRTFSTGDEHFVAFDEPAYTVVPAGSLEYDRHTLRFTYTSLVTPASVYDYDMNARTRELKKRQPVLGGYDPSQYVTERLFAAAQDSARIPITLVHKKGLERNGSNPTLLTGYGAYGIANDPSFSSERLSLLDRGFVFAMAHIRGGGDLGKTWHDAGRMLNKRNTFTDFIACAEHLIAQKYTGPDKLAIMGGSAGGLLMGAVTNLRPDLFRAVIAKVPFVDVLNTMMDASLPLTAGEFEEWGNPEDAKFYQYMRSYSPYDNVERQNFPNMLVTAGLNDPRVSYWEPAKWVARLRAFKKDNHLLLLKTNMGAGHFGASGRYDRYRETALDYAFLFHALGLPAN
jgi:oligopeptidase B